MVPRHRCVADAVARRRPRVRTNAIAREMRAFRAERDVPASGELLVLL
jgi:hypothetical protein